MKMVAMLFSLLLICCNPAHAYLDGGTGSMLLQLALGGFVGFFAVIKLYWYKIKSFFCKESSVTETDVDMQENSNESTSNYRSETERY